MPLRSHYSPLIALAAGKWKIQGKKKGDRTDQLPSATELQHLDTQNTIQSPGLECILLAGRRWERLLGAHRLRERERDLPLWMYEELCEPTKSLVFGMLSNPSAISQLVYVQSLCYLHIASPVSLQCCSINIHALYPSRSQNLRVKVLLVFSLIPKTLNENYTISITVEVNSWIN